ncbi:MarR family winged helix-turn-helix transcriptional regulator [Vogesella sp. LIG4]|uniref:MarR family winged helix-turn-helix transcriptional regulator n=1 Tax=Vogesella sp. LIG4 TaxID=1192162 RepID=UPI00081FAE2D|nr:MarR family transcriptional regulator [Vogesella sp. LIG4]SCK25506.1 DNA-binding transcriptional regulator, MarR family [Vogesella sp. LIG4]
MPQQDRMQHHQWDSSLNALTVPLFLRLQWAQGASLGTLTPVLEKFAVSLVEFDVLATLRNSPPPHQMTPSRIQEEVVITSGGLTKVLLQLEARGMVTRRQLQHDLRSKPVCLADSGQALIETAMAEAVANTAQWLHQRLSEAEIGQLSALLGRLVDE